MRLSGTGIALGLSIAWLALGVGGQPAAAESADAAAGRVLAERWCSGCHLVDAQQLQGNDGVPTFRSIGAKPWTEASFAAAITSPHPPMPTLDLTRKEIAELLAFVRSRAP
ncbi:c-type cytochrome [Blastochloris sulfoviridis]|uniref:Cytochrome c n=1 Tax=Blastochloris sulfoviridis TaxID=50712 RepID=A0A5M6I274_9HYPH|nr:c-type cytochrome [Blastochloris sulfoviridis]KAA5602272.1 cytochrome c [Blastochloris sulfoviridis]